MTDPIKILSSPNLIPMILDESHKRIVGEDDTVITLLIISQVRLVKNRHPTSDNVLINSFTRSGKDYLVKHSVTIWTYKSRYVHRSTISPAAFTYWHHGDDSWTWNGKQLHLEDISSRVIDGPVFKTMASGSNTATIVVKNTSKEFNVPGKPAMILTGYNVDINQEGIGRFPVIHLDESEGQTRAIKVNKSKMAKGIIDTTPNQPLRDALQKTLATKTVEVVIPWADKLVDLFPNTVVFRDVFDRFLDYIKSSTAIHQYQRDKDEQGRVIAIWDDYYLAKITMEKTISVKQMISTTITDENVIDFIRENPNCTKKDVESVATNHYLYSAKGLDKLESSGIIISENVYHDDARKIVKKYSVPYIPEKKIGLPMFPEGIPIKPEQVKDIKELLSNHSSKVANIAPSTPLVTPSKIIYNNSGTMVLWYIENKKSIRKRNSKGFKKTIAPKFAQDSTSFNGNEATGDYVRDFGALMGTEKPVQKRKKIDFDKLTDEELMGMV